MNETDRIGRAIEQGKKLEAAIARVAPSDASTALMKHVEEEASAAWAQRRLYAGYVVPLAEALVKALNVARHYAPPDEEPYIVAQVADDLHLGDKALANWANAILWHEQPVVAARDEGPGS